MYVENIKGRTAFVSGASAGIGEAVAKMLASNGVNLILAARRIEKLETLKNELEKNHNVKVKVIKLDFAKPEDIVSIETALEKACTLSQNERLDMALRALEKFKTVYSFNVVAPKYTKVFQKLANNNHNYGIS